MYMYIVHVNVLMTSLRSIFVVSQPPPIATPTSRLVSTESTESKHTDCCTVTSLTSIANISCSAECQIIRNPTLFDLCLRDMDARNI